MFDIAKKIYKLTITLNKKYVLIPKINEKYLKFFCFLLKSTT